jgi:predicted transcriptional regulator of viral defense system
MSGTQCYNSSNHLRFYSVPRNTTAFRKLYETAHAQGGFFTARQAAEAGYQDSVHPYQVRSGNWVREVRGVYRLAQFPTPSRPDLMVWQLWSRNRQDEPQGVFSHATALTLHDLSDVMPAKLDMTVPPGFRRMAAIPGVLRLHHARLGDREVQTIDGVHVTTPVRTLIDVIAEGAIAPELQVQAVDQALRRGLIMRRQLETARVSSRARQRIDRILKQVPDGSSTPVRHRRRVSDRPRGAAQRTRTS